jgi:ABC-type branched-subunit amino acid transport system ATPase component
VLAAPRHAREERLIREIARESLERVGLGALGNRAAESLPLGQQRSLQVARALAGAPGLLLLDEPASGLRGGERREFAALLGRLRDEGLTMLLIEHDVALVTSVADRVTVLDLGEVIAEGTPAAVCRNEAVVAAYLGASPAP